MHECPGPECEREVDITMLACPGHWYQVPKAVRNAVWREYKKAPGSPAHRHAMDLAVKAMRPLAAR
jgi:hypothetical protein